MSATLDAGPVARFLGAPALKSEGRAFPVEVACIGTGTPDSPADTTTEAEVDSAT